MQLTRRSAEPGAVAAHDELGAHVSSAGGVSHAPGRASALDAVVLQVFTKQPNRWAEPLLTEEQRRAYRAAARQHGINAASAHDSYLINLASPDEVLRARSIASFRAELGRSAALGIPFVVTHPGNAMNADVEGAVARNAEGVQLALEETDGVTVLFETTTGAGTVLGASFDQLARLLEQVPSALQGRVGVCFDTCHVWAAGYDLRGHYDDVMARFDDALGLDRIRLFHLNDSVGALGSRRDRHAHIGAGALGDEPFRRLLLDDRFRGVPKLLETPKDDDAAVADRRNLARLRGYR
jgi:deoxyribonuclease IV